MNKHHHHEPDDASLFKQRSLSQIQLKKTLEKVLKITLFIIALLMLAAVIFVYTIG
jgi:cell division protein FtsL